MAVMVSSTMKVYILLPAIQYNTTEDQNPSSQIDYCCLLHMKFVNCAPNNNFIKIINTRNTFCTFVCLLEHAE